MYGFPLTIYFLARFFGLDAAWTDGGNLWEQLFGTPVAHIVAMTTGYTLVFIGATMVVDGWRRIHRARREQALMTDGIYGRVRHPQYTGLFLIVFGEGVVHWPTIASVIAFLVIFVAYTLLARKEERTMLDQFGDEYRAYQQRVPMFFPRADNCGRIPPRNPQRGVRSFVRSVGQIIPSVVNGSVLYTRLVLELYSRRVLAWRVSNTMDGESRWVDNVFVERLWRSVKYGHVYLRADEAPAEPRAGLGRYFMFYNTRRRHSRLGRRTPDAVYIDQASRELVA